MFYIVLYLNLVISVVFGLQYFDDDLGETPDLCNVVHGKRVLFLSHVLTVSGSVLCALEMASEISACGGEGYIFGSNTGPVKELSQVWNVTILDSADAPMISKLLDYDIFVSNTYPAVSILNQLIEIYPPIANRAVVWLREGGRHTFGPLAGDAASVMRTSRRMACVSDFVYSYYADHDRGHSLVVHDTLSRRSLADFDNRCASCIRAHYRSELGISDTEFVFVMVTSLYLSKGMVELIHAALLVKEEAPSLQVRVLLAGINYDDMFLPENAKFAETLLYANGLFPGLVIVLPPVLDVWPMFVTGDAYVMNTVNEGFGRVTLEAMAAGIPVLGRRVGGTSDIITHGVTGLFHATSITVDPLKDNMLYMASHPQDARRMGRNAWKRVRENQLVARAEWARVLRSALPISESSEGVPTWALRGFDASSLMTFPPALGPMWPFMSEALRIQLLRHEYAGGSLVWRWIQMSRVIEISVVGGAPPMLWSGVNAAWGDNVGDDDAEGGNIQGSRVFDAQDVGGDNLSQGVHAPSDMLCGTSVWRGHEVCSLRLRFNGKEFVLEQSALGPQLPTPVIGAAAIYHRDELHVVG
eukprot:Rmarinus@m.1228